MKHISGGWKRPQEEEWAARGHDDLSGAIKMAVNYKFAKNYWTCSIAEFHGM